MCMFMLVMTWVDDLNRVFETTRFLFKQTNENLKSERFELFDLNGNGRKIK